MLIQELVVEINWTVSVSCWYKKNILASQNVHIVMNFETFLFRTRVEMLYIFEPYKDSIGSFFFIIYFYFSLSFAYPWPAFVTEKDIIIKEKREGEKKKDLEMQGKVTLLHSNIYVEYWWAFFSFLFWLESIFFLSISPYSSFMLYSSTLRVFLSNIVIIKLSKRFRKSHAPICSLDTYICINVNRRNRKTEK